MSSFQGRLAQADRLEKPFIEVFNQACSTHQVFKFGVESTELRHLHEYIRASTDGTSQFIRYLPDSALVRTSQRPASGSLPTTALLEFKVQDTPVRVDSFFNRVRTSHRQLNQDNPPLLVKEDIFGVEKASLDLYQQLARIDVIVVVVGWQTWRTRDQHPVRAQYAQNIVTCQVQPPSGRGEEAERLSLTYILAHLYLFSSFSVKSSTLQVAFWIRSSR